MTTAEIVRLLHGRKNGPGRWQCRCPVTRMHSYGDRHPSLSIAVGKKPGVTVLYCQAGCSTYDILAALGWRMADLFEGSRDVTAEMQARWADEDKLKVLDTRQGAYIWLQTLDPCRRNYWRAAERNIAVEIASLRRKLYPDEAARILRNETAQHLITEFGLAELWECVP